MPLTIAEDLIPFDLIACRCLIRMDLALKDILSQIRL